MMQPSSISSSQPNLLKRLMQVEPGKPAIAKAIRTAIGVGVPLLVGLISDQLPIGMTIALGAIFTSFADVGGAYSTKAALMLTATLSITLSTLVGTLAGNDPWLSVPLMLLWGFSAGFLGIYGNGGAAIGLVLIVSFLVSIALPGNLATALQNSLYYLIGGAWMMVLSLALWTIKPYQPLQQSIATCYQLIAKFIALLNQITVEPVSSRSETEQQIRTALETARSGLIQTRIAQRGRSSIGEQFTVLFQQAEEISGSAIALAEVVEASEIEHASPVIQTALWQLEQVSLALAAAISDEPRSLDPADLYQMTEVLEQERQVLRSEIAEGRVDYLLLRNTGTILQRIEALSRQFQSVAQTVKELHQNHYSPHRHLSIARETPSLLTPLIGNWTMRSVVFRHALRLGIMTAIAVLFYTSLQIPQGFWITLTIVVILKPDFGGTFKRTLQRIVGTLIGAGLAAGLAATIHNPFVLIILITLLAFVNTALMPLNYSLAVVFITPLVILLTNLTQPGNWQIAGIRMLDTTIGAAFGLIGSYLLFPAWERQRLPTQLAQTLRANAAYFQQVLTGYLEFVDLTSIAQTRQQAELENANASASFQRVLSEPKPGRSLESVMILITNLRRFSAQITTLADHLHQFSRQSRLPELDTFAEKIQSTLLDLANAIEQGNQPSPLPDLDSTITQIRTHLEALYRLREAELIAHQIATPTQKNVLDYALFSQRLDQITSQVITMHTVVIQVAK